MTHPNRFAAAALLLLLTGCIASPQQRVPFPSQDVTVTRPDLTRIYLLREDDVVIQKKEIRVFDNETEIGLVTSDSYLCWERPGGRTLGRAFYEAIDPGRGRIEGIADFDCEAGRVYYFNVRVGKSEGKPEIQLLDAEEGRRLLADRKPPAAVR